MSLTINPINPINSNIYSFKTQNQNKVNKIKLPVSNPINNLIAMYPLSYNYANFITFGYDIKPAERLTKSDFETPKYINEITKARSLYGDQEVIELGMGNPDILPPEEALKALKKNVDDKWAARYNFPKGSYTFRKAVTDWFDKRFDVKLNPGTEVMMSAGASDGVDIILSAYTEKGDKVLIPDPGYTVYRDLIAKNDLVPVPLALKPENNYLPDFDSIKEEDLKGVKAMILNYPNNPMGAFAPLDFYKKAVDFAREHNIFIIHDFDNTEITHYGDKPVGILQAPGAKDVAFEVHTFSKAHNMPGMRVGFVASNKTFIDNMLQAKYLTNNSVFTPIQEAAIAALKDKEGYIDKVNIEHRKRKNYTIDRLRQLGSETQPTQGTYYLWSKIPEGFNSDEFFKYVLHKAHVAFTPGTIYGKNGDGYVRIVMSAGTEKLGEAFDKIEKAGIRFDRPKSSLSVEERQELDKIVRGDFDLKPKSTRDLDEYKIKLAEKNEELSKRLEFKPDKLKSYLPNLANIDNLPEYLLKNEQFMYLKNTQSPKEFLGQVVDILPYTNSDLYKNISEYVKNNWTASKYLNSEVRPDYKDGKFYPDATYFALYAEDKLQGLVNLEIQDDGCFWVRNLNTAPWNQGETPLIKGVGTALMARIISFSMETDKFPIKLATSNPKNITFYKNLGFKEAGTKKFYPGDVPNQVLSMDKETANIFLEEYQRFLSF